MGLAYNVYLNSHKIYGCKSCKTHLSNHEDIISRVCSSSLSFMCFCFACILCFCCILYTKCKASCLINSLPSSSPSISLTTIAKWSSKPKLSHSSHPNSHRTTHTDATRPQNFRGQHGKAYLFNSVVNIKEGEASERNMTTGRHIVRDITCRQCGETVGWKYDKAYEASEKYKEGKFILEAELLCNVT